MKICASEKQIRKKLYQLVFNSCNAILNIDMIRYSAMKAITKSVLAAVLILYWSMCRGQDQQITEESKFLKKRIKKWNR